MQSTPIFPGNQLEFIQLIDLGQRIKMLIKKRQTAFTRDGKDSASYRLLRNKVQWEIRSAKYDYYHHKVSYLEQTDKKMVETNQVR